MKIALVSDFFYPIIGGISTHIEDLANMLVKRGHEVYVITKKAEYDDSRFKFNVVRVDTVFKTYGILDVPKLKDLQEALKKIDPDVVHSHHMFSPLSLLALKEGHKIGAKTLITNHSIHVFYDLDYFWSPTSYILLPQKYYLNYADEIIAVSNAAKDFAKKFVERDDIHVIPNGIFVNQFKPKKKNFNGKNVLFVSRLVFRKGLQDLLSAISMAKKEIKDINLTIIGKGYMEYYAKFYRRLFRLGKNINIKNDVNSKKELIKYYQNSDVFVLPSIYGESFGIVILEAMASMTPVIASYQGGIKEVVKHKKTGFLFPRRNTKKMAEYIEALLLDKKLWLKMSKNSLKEVKNYDWKIIVNKIEKLYKN